MIAPVPIIGATAKRTFGDREVCHVLSAAGALFGDKDMLLSLMSRALISLAKTFGVPRATIVGEIERTWDQTEVVKPVPHRVQ